MEETEETRSGKRRRASIDEIASMLQAFVEEELPPVEPRPSVDMVSKVLRGMIASHRASSASPMSMIDDLELLMPTMRISYDAAERALSSATSALVFPSRPSLRCPPCAANKQSSPADTASSLSFEIDNCCGKCVSGDHPSIRDTHVLSTVQQFSNATHARSDSASSTDKFSVHASSISPSHSSSASPKTAHCAPAMNCNIQNTPLLVDRQASCMITPPYNANSCALAPLPPDPCTLGNNIPLDMRDVIIVGSTVSSNCALFSPLVPSPWSTSCLESNHFQSDFNEKSNNCGACGPVGKNGSGDSTQSEDFEDTQSNTLTTRRQSKRNHKSHLAARYAAPPPQDSALSLHHPKSIPQEHPVLLVPNQPFPWQAPRGRPPNAARTSPSATAAMVAVAKAATAAAAATGSHIVDEDGMRLHYCTDCGRGFRNPSNLTRHRRVHTGEKPYLCTHCGLAFRNSSNRRKHERQCNELCSAPSTAESSSASPSSGP